MSVWNTKWKQNDRKMGGGDPDSKKNVKFKYKHMNL